MALMYKHFQTFLIFLLSFLFLLLFFNRGFIYHDEGYILHSADRFVNGEIPYKDFHFIYTPGILFALWPLFKIFGESILVGRILTLLIQLMSSLLIYYLSKKICKSFLVSALSVFIFLNWGSSHLNFPWPIVFSLFSGLLAIYFLIKRKYFLAGFLTFTVFLFKQNFGLAVFLTFAIYFFFTHKTNKSYWLGMGIGLGFFILYLFLTGSAGYFFNDFYFYSIKKVLFEGAFATGFPAFYLIPGAISLITVIFSATKRNYVGFLLSLFVFLFYLFGTRPTTDYTHLVYLMAMLGIPLAVLYGIYKNRIVRIGLISLMSLICLVGLRTVFYKGYYKWEAPILEHIYKVNNSKIGILVDQKYQKVIPILQKEINLYTKKDKYIFVFYRAPMFYFILDRKNPTKFIDLAPNLLDETMQKEVIGNLEKKKVKLVFTHDFPSGENPLIADYIRKNFKPIKKVYEFGIWIKK